MTRLVICEKTSQARAVAIGLGVDPKGRLPWRSDGWIIAAARGHLLESAEPEAYDPRYGEGDWSAEHLPILPDRFRWEVRDGKKDAELLESLVSLIRDPDVVEVVNACDAGREGELIFKLIYQAAGTEKPVRRAWFSSLTGPAIRDAFANLRDDADMKGLEAAAFARTEGDWLLGINATRAASIAANAERFNTVRMGRVQTPTLRILVEREDEIDAYDPTPFYRVEAELAEGRVVAALVDGEGERRTFPEPDAAGAEAWALEGAEAVLAEYRVEPDKRPAPLPFDLATLQVEAGRAFGWSAKRTLDQAQGLYEKQWISYPRTDSRFLTWDLKGQVKDGLAAVAEAVPELAERARGLAALADAGELPGRPFNPSRVRDHHAIIPTGKRRGFEDLSEGHRRLYEMIARRTVAAFLPPTRGEIHEARFEAAGRTLAAGARRTLEPGWREVEPRGGDDPPERLEALEALRAGGEGASVGPVRSATVEERHRPRPRAHTDGTLIRAMERAGAPEGGRAAGGAADTGDAGGAGDADDPDDTGGADARPVGIGTPATRADTIERLLKSGYAERDRTAIYATPRGRRLIRALDDVALTSPALTARWEERLAAIEEGREEKTRFDRDIRELTRTTVEKILARRLESIDAPPEEVAPCPRCDGVILEKSRVYGCSSWKSYDEPGCGWAVFRNTARGRIGRREALVRIEEDRPHRTDVGSRLPPAEAGVASARIPGMEPYAEAPAEGEPLPRGDDDPAAAEAWDRAIEEVVEAEGPVMVSRVLRALEGRARKGGWATGKAKKQVNRRTSALLRDGRLVEVDDGRTPKGQQDRVVRSPDQPEVRLRERGPRDLLEIPWRELALAGNEPGEVARAFQVPADKLEDAYRDWIEEALGSG